MQWSEYVELLGEEEGSGKLTALLMDLGERPALSETPDEYNDPGGRTKYYKMRKSGMEIGFREGLLNHIHYRGMLPPGVQPGRDEAFLIAQFGEPDWRGGGKYASGIGYVYRWVKYAQMTNALRFEFSDSPGYLRKISLMRENVPGSA